MLAHDVWPVHAAEVHSLKLAVLTHGTQSRLASLYTIQDSVDRRSEPSQLASCNPSHPAAGDVEVSRTIVEATKLFKVTVSFGNVISLISLPCFMSHASIPAEVRAARGLPDDLVRISAGIEDVGDLIADLKQAMDKAWAEQQQRQPAAAGSSSSSNGSSAAAGSSNGSDRIQQLEQRILQLEAQLQAGQQHLQNSHTH